MDLTTVFAPLCGALVGLCLGSFLNVVIHRIPLRMAAEEAQALNEALQARGLAAPSADAVGPPHPQGHSLLHASRCPHCLHPLKWRHNIPLLGFAVLRGRCAHCGQAIAWRYPMVELLAGLWLGLCCARWGLSPQALAVGGAGLALLALAAIDAEHLLLPDAITLPLLWAGLLCASAGWHALPLQHALWGAALGYTLMAGVAWLFWRLTGKEGLGGGEGGGGSPARPGQARGAAKGAAGVLPEQRGPAGGGAGDPGADGGADFADVARHFTNGVTAEPL